MDSQSHEVVLEVPCAACGGTGVEAYTRDPCGLCEGACFEPTELGEKILALVLHNAPQILNRGR